MARRTPSKRRKTSAPLARRVKAFALVASGQSNAAIAAELGVSERQVRRYRDDLRGDLEGARKRAIETLNEATGEALEILRELMADPDPQIRLQATKTWLDRAGVIGGVAVQLHQPIQINPAADLGRADDELTQIELMPEGAIKDAALAAWDAAYKQPAETEH